MVSPCRHRTASATRSVDPPSSLSQIGGWSRVALPALTWLTRLLAPTTLMALHMLTGSLRSKRGTDDGPAVWKLESTRVSDESRVGGSRGGVRCIPKAGRSGRVTPDSWTARPVFGAGCVPTARRQGSGDLPKLLQPLVSGDVTWFVAVPFGITNAGECWLPPFDRGTVLEASRITNGRARPLWREPRISIGGPCPWRSAISWRPLMSRIPPIGL